MYVTAHVMLLLARTVYAGHAALLVSSRDHLCSSSGNELYSMGVQIAYLFNRVSSFEDNGGARGVIEAGCL